jgi:hypothetical protein
MHAFVDDLKHPDRPSECLFGFDAAERVERDPSRWAYEVPQPRKVIWDRSRP